MIELMTSPIPVNSLGEPAITREEMWRALVWKSERADLFVDAIVRCQVLQRFEDGFLREIDHLTPLGTETIQERIYLVPQRRISFLRLGGQVPGLIDNLLDEEDELAMRFGFCLALGGVAPGGAEEVEFGRQFLAGYAACADRLIAAARRYAATGLAPVGIA